MKRTAALGKTWSPYTSELAHQYAQNTVNQTGEAVKQAEGAAAHTAETAARLETLEDLLLRTEHELYTVNESNLKHYQLFESQKLEIEALRQSASWRITAPLRLMLSYLQALLDLFSRIAGLPKRIFLGLRAVAYRILYSRRPPEQLQPEPESIDLPVNQPVITESMDTSHGGARGVGVGHANSSPLAVITELTNTFTSGARNAGVGHANRSPLENHFK